MGNKKGFTLVELLAAMVILGIISAIAIPNVMGILKNSRNNAYVEDAKKFISLAEYKFRAGNGIKKPDKGKMIVISLSFVDNSEFENAPNGNAYDKEKSKVFISKDSSGTYKYYVILVEDMGSSYRGIYNISYEDLYTKSASELVSNPEGTIQNICKLSNPVVIDRLNNVSGTYQYRYTADTSCSDGDVTDNYYSGISS